jgi:hypothetical protein
VGGNYTNRRTYLSGTLGTLLPLAGCLGGNEPERAWDLHIDNESGRQVALTVSILDDRSALVSKELELSRAEDWTLQSNHGTVAPVDVVVDVANGVTREATWDDPDGSNPLVVDINSTEEVEFFQGVA